MHAERKHLGEVSFVQVQERPLKVGEAGQRVYDPVSLVVVPRVSLTPRGVVGKPENGGHLLDAHHADHPESRFGGANGISVGFSGHYERMRARYGDHLSDGIAGENVIIRTGETPDMEDLEGILLFENPDGAVFRFRVLKAMAPCNEYSHFVHQAGERLAPDVLKKTMQFLDGGTRGFTLELLDMVEAQLVPGSQVYLIKG